MEQSRKFLCLDEPVVYRIKVGRHLNQTWSMWFAGMIITHEICNQEPMSVLVGELPDQSALCSVLRKICDLGMPLISLELIEVDSSHSG